MRKQSNISVNDPYISSCGRYCSINICSDRSELRVVNIYAPNHNSPGFFNEIFQREAQYMHKMLMIGNYNLVLNEKMDRKNSTHNNVKAAEVICANMNEMNSSEVWRVINKKEVRYSWYRSVMRNGNTHIQASRIDLALISTGILDHVNNSFYMAGYKTDHSALVITYNTSVHDRGPGYWKLNNTVLSDMEYVTVIKNLIGEKKFLYKDLGVKERWELIKTSIRDISIKYTKNKASDRRLIIAQLTEKITHMEDSIHTLSENELKLLNESKIDLEEKMAENVHGLIFRSKAKWAMEGEQNSNIFTV